LIEEFDLPANVKHNIYRQNAERLLFSRRAASTINNTPQ
jgi:hypothetical protein